MAFGPEARDTIGQRYHRPEIRLKFGLAYTPAYEGMAFGIVRGESEIQD